MSSAFARALNKVVHDDQFTVTEMADVAGCSDRHLYNVADLTNTGDLSVSKAERLCRWLCSHGETRPTLAFVCTNYTLVKRQLGRVNGTVKDELVTVVKAIAQADESFEARDDEALASAIELMEAALTDLNAELAALRGAR